MQKAHESFLRKIMDASLKQQYKPVYYSIKAKDDDLNITEISSKNNTSANNLNKIHKKKKGK